jgi:SOS response regulatory protein OraA/RecX
MQVIDYALILLRKKQYFTGELKKKCIEKFTDEKTDEVVKAIDKLIKLRFLNDELFLKPYIECKMNVNYYGEKRLRAICYEKGIDSQQFKTAFNEFDEQFLDKSLKGLIYKSYKNPKATKQKVIEKCLRKGWDFAKINKIVNQYEEVQNSNPRMSNECPRFGEHCETA